MLRQVHPHFIHVVREALKHEFAGGPVELLRVTAECDSVLQQEGCGHYFTVGLPFAGTRLEWEVLFQVEHPERSPDFLCVSEDFDYDPKTYTNVMKDWDFKDPLCLAKLLKKMNIIFNNYQIERLSSFPKIQETYSALVNAGVAESKMEAYFLTQQKKYNLLIHLDPVEADLPVDEKSTCYQTYAGLLFSLGTNGNVLTESLVLSPRLETMLRPKLSQIQIPSISSSSVTPRFVQEFNTRLNAPLKKIRDGMCQRRHILAALIDLYEMNMVSFDEIQYNNVTLQFMINQSRYVLHLKLDGDMETTLFALDRLVKVSPGEDPVWYAETEKLFFTENPSSDDFHKYLHLLLSVKLKRFVANATATASV